MSCLETSADPESRRELEGQLAELQIQKKKLQEEISQQPDPRHELRPRKKVDTFPVFPVAVRGHNLEYKPWQNTDI